MQLSKTQITALLTEVASQEDGFNELLRMSFEALMKAEREEHLLESTNDKGNGFRQVKAYGGEGTFSHNGLKLVIFSTFEPYYFRGADIPRAYSFPSFRQPADNLTRLLPSRHSFSLELRYLQD